MNLIISAGYCDNIPKAMPHFDTCKLAGTEVWHSHRDIITIAALIIKFIPSACGLHNVPRDDPKGPWSDLSTILAPLRRIIGVRPHVRFLE